MGNEPRFSFLACLLLRSMTISMVSIWRGGKLCSTGSDFTGVLGGVGEGFRRRLLEKDTVRDRRRVRVSTAGWVVGWELLPWDRYARICSVCNTRSSRVKPSVRRRDDMGEFGFCGPWGSAIVVCHSEEDARREMKRVSGPRSTAVAEFCPALWTVSGRDSGARSWRESRRPSRSLISASQCSHQHRVTRCTSVAWAPPPTS